MQACILLQSWCSAAPGLVLVVLLSSFPFVGGLALSAKMDSGTKDPGRLVISFLLAAPPKSSWLVFRAAHVDSQGLLLLMKPGLDPFLVLPGSSFSPDTHSHGCCLPPSIWGLGHLHTDEQF
uniref:Uncharacterized protein n=1 Tax=Sus scrofa TaxID=9823 RepID=A0A480GV93_PIG